MTVRPAKLDPSRQATVLAEMLEVHARLVGPNGRPLDQANRRIVAGIGAAAACYAMPPFVREVGAGAAPLLWTWPADSWATGSRREELLLAAALGLAGAVQGEDIPAAPMLSIVRDESASTSVAAQPRRTTTHRRDQLVTSLERIRRGLIDPEGTDPARSLRPRAHDRSALAAACYLLPPELRTLTKAGIPQMWAWPDSLWTDCDDRTVELLTGTALVLATIELTDLTESYRGRSAPLVVIAGAGATTSAP